MRTIGEDWNITRELAVCAVGRSALLRSQELIYIHTLLMKDISVFSALRAFALSDRNRILCAIVLLLGLVPIIPGFVSTWTLANHRTLTYYPFERWNMHSAFEVLTIQTSDASLRTHYLPRSLYRTLLIELHALEASLTYIKVVGTLRGSSSEYHGLNTTSSYNHRSIMSDLRGSHPHPSSYSRSSPPVSFQSNLYLSKSNAFPIVKLQLIAQ